MALKLKEKVEVLFDKYWQLHKSLTPQSWQSSGAQTKVESGMHLLDLPLIHKS